VDLLNNAAFTLSSAGAVAGTGNVDGDIIAMDGFENALIIGVASTSANNGVLGLTALGGATSGAVNVVTTASGKVQYTSTGIATEHAILLDIKHFPYRYIQPRMTRLTQNITAQAIWLLRYGPLKGPTTSQTVTSEVVATRSVVSPTT